MSTKNRIFHIFFTNDLTIPTENNNVTLIYNVFGSVIYPLTADAAATAGLAR